MIDENSAGFRSKEEEQAAKGFIAPNTGGENVEIPSTETEPLDVEIQNCRSTLESLKAELPSGPGDLRSLIESFSLRLEDIVKTKDMLASRDINDLDLDFDLPRLYQPGDLGLDSIDWRGQEAMYDSYSELQKQFSVRILPNIKSQIEQKHHLKPVEVNIGGTFDVHTHVDNEFHRLPADARRGTRHNQIYALLRPGFIVNGEVKRKAMVKRFVEVYKEPVTEPKAGPEGSAPSEQGQAPEKRYKPRNPDKPWRDY